MEFNVVKIGRNGASFRSSAKLTDCKIEIFPFPATKSRETMIAKYGVFVADMIFDLALRVPSIDMVFVEPYEVTIYQEGHFPIWNDRIDRIVRHAFERAEQASAPAKKVIIEAMPNDRIMYFHTDFEVSKTSHESFWRPLRPSSTEPLSRVGEPGATLVRRLIVIPGVTEIRMDPYRVIVEIAKAFAWEGPTGVTEKVKDVLREVYGMNIDFTTSRNR